jgi:hypothetical protein
VVAEKKVTFIIGVAREQGRSSWPAGHPALFLRLMPAEAGGASIVR